ncbi:FAD binding domain-containing protein [Paenibacillus mucilaginosus]|uniref:Molybdopterin dehydrogenase FAD-binding protein n=1 Tax=Paenibacillus mucilaginosus (strain KNP414) TaxID=1036673 RepID=F8FDB9_PAEMK|nr:FAD binding domain-containing protein [Paenibacillus mucilaginosus]AEI41779.1 molybdopterin dehydrogenase FAD-binding protein [Paenibacillus mucilaginosus KNP414]MCG7214463.1 FAD binding domain-containing protein [Paenibacillus mucilaginosus]WDM30745.1 FAD binding domain-containing protein [Paenibacillus mucilaginosus]
MNTIQAAGGLPPGLWQPLTVAEAWELKRNLGGAAVFTAGGTLLRTQWEAGTVPLPAQLISLEAVAELQGIRISGGQILAGSQVRLEACRSQKVSGLLAAASRTIGAPSIRRLATLGGNVASGIGDALPALLVKDAVLHWYGDAGYESVGLAEWLDARAGGAAEGRLLTGVELQADEAVGEKPDAGERAVGFYRKIMRREAFVPSLAAAALTAVIREDGTLRAVRVAAGGGSSAARRLRGTEQELEGRGVDATLVRKLQTGVQEEWPAFADAFASAEYRRLAAANVLAAGLWELRRPEAEAGRKNVEGGRGTADEAG